MGFGMGYPAGIWAQRDDVVMSEHNISYEHHLFGQLY